jgi:hypothetical protein
LSPISDTTVVPSVIELQGRFPGLGKVWATTVHEKLRHAKRKSFHEQVADQIIQSVVKKRKISLLDFDELRFLSRFSDVEFTVRGSYRVQDRLVRRAMPHRLAKPKQDVSGFLNLHDEEQILERITSQDWSGLALKPTLDMGRGVMATRFLRSGSVVCDYHGPVLKKNQAESLRRSMSAAESNYMCFFKHDSAALHRRSDCGLCLPPEDSDHFWADGEPFRGPSEPTHGL